MYVKSPPSMLSADQPLSGSAEDRLNRWPFAKELARSIRSVRPDTGFVYSLTGPWGSGKTTVLNFTERLLDDRSGQENDHIVVVHFNAWWISGSDRLLQDFFKQVRFGLEAPFARKFKSLSRSLTEYSKAVEPLPYVGRGAAVLHRFGEVRKTKESDLNALRKKIDNKLEEFSGRIVVVIDDVDRLRPDEIRLIFRLVKAVANFPRTIYLLAYDEPVVANAVGDGNFRVGREYLDKIVQLALTIPRPDQSTLGEWFQEDLDDVLEGTPDRLLSCPETHGLLWPFVQRLLTTPRHVVRFLNLLRATYPMVRGEVNALHFVFIQALRQFAPTLHAFVANNGNRLGGLDGTNEEAKKDLEQRIRNALTTDAGADQIIDAESVQEILGRLFGSVKAMFPSMLADNCSIGRSEYFLRYFFLGVPPGTLSEAERRQTMTLISNPEAFGSKLKELASPVRVDGGSRLKELLPRLRWDDAVHQPVNHVQSVLRAFYTVGDELLRDTPMAELSDPERLTLAKEILDVARAVISREMTQDERRDLLARILAEASALFTVAYHLYEFSKEPEQQATLGAASLDTLKGVIVERFRKAARDGSLQSTPFLVYVLARYSEWADKPEVQEYLRALIETDQGLCDYLVGSMYRGELDRSAVEKLPSGKNDDLMRRCKKMLKTAPAWLTERYRVALESYLERVTDGTAHMDRLDECVDAASEQ